MLVDFSQVASFGWDCLLSRRRLNIAVNETANCGEMGRFSHPYIYTLPPCDVIFVKSVSIQFLDDFPCNLFLLWYIMFQDLLCDIYWNVIFGLSLTNLIWCFFVSSGVHHMSQVTKTKILLICDSYDILFVYTTKAVRTFISVTFYEGAYMFAFSTSNLGNKLSIIKI